MMQNPLDEEMLLSILDNLPEPILLYTPVFEPGTQAIKDFEIIYLNNEAARQAAAMSVNDFLGERVSTMRNTNEELRKMLFADLLHVDNTGEPQESRYYNPIIDIHFHAKRLKIKMGVLTVARNINREIALQRESERQESLVTKILDSSLDAWLICEAVMENNNVVDFVIIRINHGYTKLVGISEEEVVGKRYLSRFPAAEKNGVFDMNCRVFDSGVSERHQIRYQDDGLDAWYDVGVSKLDEKSLLITFSDSTEQRRVMNEIQQKNALLHNLLSHSANGISVSEMIRNEEGTVVDSRTILANDAAIAYSGIPKEVLLTKTSVEIEPHILETPLYKLSLHTLETGEPSFLQYNLESTGKWLEISVSRMDSNHLITIFTDITASKAAQLEQERLVERLKRSNNALEEFARAASHDLKEPIRKVHVFTDRLKASMQSRSTEAERKMLERIEVATKRMMLLIEDLLAYADIDNSKQREPEMVNLNDKVSSVLSDLEVLIQEKEAVVNVEGLPTIRGYRRPLRQLFQNLLTNALKYSKPGEKPEITITCQTITGSEAAIRLPASEAEKTYYQIEVKDNGIGFDQQYAEKIFGVFTRLHDKTEYSGTGIGLSIVKKVVESHRGYVYANSQKGVGSTFSVLLPAE
ncbi:MAG TPA: ATP-binding protein [Flavisolibacter sp.]|jgi:signal transduction histidine kinase|nr:ATP-binding protein [Flavisolibacter sp.]